jgi:hypothetical protein
MKVELPINYQFEKFTTFLYKNYKGVDILNSVKEKGKEELTPKDERDVKEMQEYVKWLLEEYNKVCKKVSEYSASQRRAIETAFRFAVENEWIVFEEQKDKDAEDK